MHLLCSFHHKNIYYKIFRESWGEILPNAEGGSRQLAQGLVRTTSESCHVSTLGLTFSRSSCTIVLIDLTHFFIKVLIFLRC